jgi:hypothetical protein
MFVFLFLALAWLAVCVTLKYDAPPYKYPGPDGLCDGCVTRIYPHAATCRLIAGQKAEEEQERRRQARITLERMEAEIRRQEVRARRAYRRAYLDAMDKREMDRFYRTIGRARYVSPKDPYPPLDIGDIWEDY